MVKAVERIACSLCEGAEGAWSRSGHARRPHAGDPVSVGVDEGRPTSYRKAVIELGLTGQSSNRLWRK